MVAEVLEGVARSATNDPPHLLCKFCISVVFDRILVIFCWDFVAVSTVVNGTKGHRTCVRILIRF